MTPGLYDVPSYEDLARLHQAILNQRPIPPFQLQRLDREHIPVTIRVVWERDGEEHIDATAVDWVGRDVLCWWVERRIETRGAWLDAGDVRRR